MKYMVKFTSQFKKDLKLAKKQNRNIIRLYKIIERLSKNQKLDATFRDHELIGNFKGVRECHIAPDWLLLYEYIKDINVLVLHRLGTHAELF